MVLIIGGYAQGQLEYVKQNYDVAKEKFFEGCLPDTFSTGAGRNQEAVVLMNLNAWASKEILANKDPMDRLEEVLKLYPNLILISDEVGSGIVPMEAEERRLREDIGHMQVELAKRADEVVRVACGIGQRIK